MEKNKQNIKTNKILPIKASAFFVIYKDARTAKLEHMQKLSHLQSEVRNAWNSLKNTNPSIAMLMKECIEEDKASLALVNLGAKEQKFLDAVSDEATQKAVDDLLAARRELRRELTRKPRGNEVGLRVPDEVLEELGRKPGGLLWVPADITDLRVCDMQAKLHISISLEDACGKMIVKSIKKIK